MLISSLIEELAASKELLSESQVAELLHAIPLGSHRLVPEATPTPHGYSRHLLFASDVVSLYLMIWQPGQASPIHDHAGSLCGLKVLAGHAREVTYDVDRGGALVPGRVTHLTEGDVVVSKDHDIHEVINERSSADTLVTLHLYSPPLESNHVYPREDLWIHSYSHRSVTIDCRKNLGNLSQGAVILETARAVSRGRNDPSACIHSHPVLSTTQASQKDDRSDLHVTNTFNHLEAR